MEGQIETAQVAQGLELLCLLSASHPSLSAKQSIIELTNNVHLPKTTTRKKKVPKAGKLTIMCNFLKNNSFDLQLINTNNGGTILKLIFYPLQTY